MKRPRTKPAHTTVTVTLTRAHYRHAARLTGAHTELALGSVLARWVADAAHAALAPGSWERWALETWLREHPFPLNTRSVRRPRGTPPQPSL